MGLSEELINIIDLNAFLFSDRNGDSFARVLNFNHQIVVPLSSNQFRHWIGRKCYEDLKKYPRETEMREIIIYAEGKARAEGEVHDVFSRVAGDHNRILIDLVDEDGSYVEVTPNGWQILAGSPDDVFFVRSNSTLKIPKPETGGSLDLLRELLNLKDEDDWKLLVAWILGALNPKGPFPILMLNGGPGTAKSTTSSFIKRLVDPSGAPLRSLPTSERDAMVMATGARVLVFDNVSHMSNDTSDLFCRIATGTGFSLRKMFTNSDEKVFSVMLANIFNGIPDFYSSRSDLVDRSIGITLKPISSMDRKSAKLLEAEFEARRPMIFGALMDALSACLRYLPIVNLREKPKMADFAEFVTAAERHLKWSDGSIVKLLERNRREAESMILENCVYTDIIKALVPHRGKEWKGSAKELLEQIEIQIGDDSRKRRQVPQTPSALSGSLRRYIPAFASAGIEIDCDGKTSGSNSRRVITIRRAYPHESISTSSTGVARDGSDVLGQASFEPSALALPAAPALIDTSKKACFGDSSKFDRSSDTCMECRHEFDCQDSIAAAESGNAEVADEAFH